MSESRRQSLIIIAISLLVLSAIFAYFALSQPRVYVNGSPTTAQSNESASGVSVSKTYDDSTDNFPINLNTCTAEDLLAVSGIGESKASAIIEYRDVIGGYTSVEQIKNISGIGDALYEKVSPYLCV